MQQISGNRRPYPARPGLSHTLDRADRQKEADCQGKRGLQQTFYHRKYKQRIQQNGRLFRSGELMLDLKTTCLLRGIAGVLFGFFALFFPGEVILGFDVLFWIVGLSAPLLDTGVISLMVPKFVVVVLIPIIASMAIINGFTDIALALGHLITTYLPIQGIIIPPLSCSRSWFFSFHIFRLNLIISVVGTFARVFGLFSVIRGCYNVEETVMTV